MPSCPPARLRPRAVRIRLSVITGSDAVVSRADGESSIGDPIESESPAPDAHSGVEETERDVLLSERGAESFKCAGDQSEHDGWWQSGCGAVSLKRGSCWNCGAVRERMAHLEEAAFLDESRGERVYKTSVARLERGKRKEAEAAKESLERLAEQGYGGSGERAREAGMKSANLSKGGRREPSRALERITPGTFLLESLCSVFGLMFQSEQSRWRLRQGRESR